MIRCLRSSTLSILLLIWVALFNEMQGKRNKGRDSRCWGFALLHSKTMTYHKYCNELMCYLHEMKSGYGIRDSPSKGPQIETQGRLRWMSAYGFPVTVWKCRHDKWLACSKSGTHQTFLRGSRTDFNITNSIEKLTVAQLVNKWSVSYGFRRFICVFSRVCHWSYPTADESTLIPT